MIDVAAMRATLSGPHREGLPFIAAGAAVAVLGGFFFTTLLWVGLLFALFCAFFFRDPDRVTPVQPGLVVAPADGRVVTVAPAVPPAELGLAATPVWRVGIFLSVLDVHVNRYPADGRVARIVYRHGSFASAGDLAAGENNERNGLVLETPDGRSIAVVQIAGQIARRIVCLVREGDTALAGARFGLIRFGSRVDVYLPQGVVPRVIEGQRMIGAETILADLNAPGGEAPKGVLR